MFRKILLPVDFTAKNEAALTSALEIAGRGETASEITLLHVIEAIEHLEPGEMADFYRSLETRATARLFALQERFKEAGLAVRQELLIGRRAETIVRYAEDREMDLVILSSHKVDRDHPALGLGTLSYRIGIVVRCPVLLVK